MNEQAKAELRAAGERLATDIGLASIDALGAGFAKLSAVMHEVAEDARAECERTKSDTIYRKAEMIEERRAELEAELASGQLGRLKAAAARKELRDLDAIEETLAKQLDGEINEPNAIAARDAQEDEIVVREHTRKRPRSTG